LPQLKPKGVLEFGPVVCLFKTTNCCILENGLINRKSCKGTRGRGGFDIAWLQKQGTPPFHSLGERRLRGQVRGILFNDYSQFPIPIIVGDTRLGIVYLKLIIFIYKN